MARVLFMTSVYKFEDKGNLNVDLVDEFVSHGHQVDVMTPVERKYGARLEIETHPGLRVIRFPCLNFRGEVSLIEKGLSTLSLGYLYRHFLRSFLSDAEYDLAIYTTLPITYAPVLKYLKRKHGTFCYLLHKDFFPQSAVDLGYMTKRSPSYRVFRNIEAGLYRSSDAIGVMSPRNVDHLLEQNPDVATSKLEICPNAVRPLDASACARLRGDRWAVRELYSIPQERVVYLYGGNISRAQGIDFVIQVAKRFGECAGSHLLFIGSGNEIGRLRNELQGVANVQVMDYLPKEEFDRVAAVCDVGLVFLDYRFTIANIPSRMLAHLSFSQPILAATDEYTDLRAIVTDGQLGLWGPSNDVDRFLGNVCLLTGNKEMRDRFGSNARAYLDEHCNVESAYEIIASHRQSLCCKNGRQVDGVCEEGEVT